LFQQSEKVGAAGRLRQRIQIQLSRAGYGRPGSIPQDMTFLDWCRDLAAKGLKVDNKPFDLDDRPSLVPLYAAIPTTIKEALRRTLVLMKGAQLGATVLEMLADLYMAIKFEPAVIGLFLPDQALAGDKSKRRFLPIVRSIPDVHRKLTTRIDGDKSIKVGEGDILTRIMGDSSFLFLWTSGGVTTESRPMDILSLDEVQGMSLGQIDKVYERMSASKIRFRFMLSTANIPDADIDFWYKQGTQNAWHTRCDGCGAEIDLSEHFPACVDYNTTQHAGAPENEYVYICPACRSWIPDTQHGRFIEGNPGASTESYHISQLISPTITPRDLMEAWNRAVTGDQRKTFFNRKLGRPYIDKDQLPVTMAHCLACVDEGKRIGLTWETSGRDCVMGIDQMGSFNVVIIKRRLGDGRQAVVHVEAIFNDSPFDRCAALMRAFGVAVCVVEQLPNVNDARRFANKFPGKVFLAGYADLRDDMMVWGDNMTTSDRRTAEDDRSRHSVSLHQYKAMQTALFRVRDKFCLFPDPQDLIQKVIDRGEEKLIPIVRDWLFVHLTKTALVVEEDEETRRRRPKVMKVGIDPHFSFANMLCDVAWARIHGMGSFIMPDTTKDTVETPLAQRVEKNMPGLPNHILAMIDQTAPGTCGRCSAYDKDRGSYCSMRDLIVQPRDPGCTIYDPALPD
jgi:hypothetical protein